MVTSLKSTNLNELFYSNTPKKLNQPLALTSKCIQTTEKTAIFFISSKKAWTHSEVVCKSKLELQMISKNKNILDGGDWVRCSVFGLQIATVSEDDEKYDFLTVLPTNATNVEGTLLPLYLHTVFPYLLSLTTSLSEAQSCQSIYILKVTNELGIIHTYLQIQSHNQIDTLNV